MVLFLPRSLGNDTSMWFDTYTIAATAISTALIPEPSTLMIWALGLLGLAWYGRRRK